MRCIDCQHMVSDKSHQHAAQAGLVRCSVVLAPTGHYKTATYQRNCLAFAQADGVVIEKRAAWFKKFEWSNDNDSAGD